MPRTGTIPQTPIDTSTFKEPSDPATQEPTTKKRLSKSAKRKLAKRRRWERERALIASSSTSDINTSQVGEEFDPKPSDPASTSAQDPTIKKSSSKGAKKKLAKRRREERKRVEIASASSVINTDQTDSPSSALSEAQATVSSLALLTYQPDPTVALSSIFESATVQDSSNTNRPHSIHLESCWQRVARDQENYEIKSLLSELLSSFTRSSDRNNPTEDPSSSSSPQDTSPPLNTDRSSPEQDSSSSAISSPEDTPSSNTTLSPPSGLSSWSDWWTRFNARNPRDPPLPQHPLYPHLHLLSPHAHSLRNPKPLRTTPPPLHIFTSTNLTYHEIMDHLPPTYTLTLLSTPVYHELSTLLGPNAAHDTKDIWLTSSPLNASSDIPGLPPAYERVHELGKVVYARGIPKHWDSKIVTEVFLTAGCVVRTPVVIALPGTEIADGEGKGEMGIAVEVFRWVVMGSAEEVQNAFEMLNGIAVAKLWPGGGKGMLILSRAMAPGRTMRVVRVDEEGNEVDVKGKGKQVVVPAIPNVAKGQTTYAHPKRDMSRDSIHRSIATLGPSDPLDSLPIREWAVAAPIGTPQGVVPEQVVQRNVSQKRVIIDASGEIEGERKLSALWKAPPRNESETSTIKATSVLDPQATPRARAPSLQPPAPVQVNTNVARDRAASTTSTTSTASTILATPTPAGPSTWANIASSSAPSTKLINLQPSSHRQSSAPRLHPVNREAVTSIRNPSSSWLDPSDPPTRVVFLLNIPNNLTLQNVSDGITEGPVAKIGFGFQDDDPNRRFAGVMFEWAYDADTFFKRLMKEREMRQPGKFRFIVDAEMGDPYERDEELEMMHSGASRRLTIVKARFFFMFQERQLRDLCERLVGTQNIQLVWLYNGGNATVVFADVKSAVAVKVELDRRAASAGMPGGESSIWEALLTTFSKDPCIQPLELKTALQ